MLNILVTGKSGQLGSEIHAIREKYPEYHFVFTNSKTLDITNHEAVKVFVVANNIQAIINCAAYTAVDKAESESKRANDVNHLAVANLATMAKAYSIKLIHISTDYVFDGTNYKPYTESDAPNPQSVYGQTKLDGELAVQKINPKNSIIIRTSWVYSRFGNNFVKTMLRLGAEHDTLNVVADQIGSPTNAADLAKVILDIVPQLNNKKVEVFHYSNEGVCSWYDFAQAIFDIKEIEIKLYPIETEQYPTPAKRPFYSVMNKKHIVHKFQIEIPYYSNSLNACLSKLEINA